eukprot:366376-Chlamydomonas_euryale.AAC.3
MLLLQPASGCVSHVRAAIGGLTGRLLSKQLCTQVPFCLQVVLMSATLTAQDAAAAAATSAATGAVATAHAQLDCCWALTGHYTRPVRKVGRHSPAAEEH